MRTLRAGGRRWRATVALGMLASLLLPGTAAAGTSAAGTSATGTSALPRVATVTAHGRRNTAAGARHRQQTAPPATEPVPPAAAYVLFDARTGDVLAAHNEHLRLSPASLTKVLTALVAVRYLPAGAGVAATPTSESAYPNLVNMEVGVAWPLSDVLQAMLVYSANDAAYAVAERVSGSLGAFVPVMQRAARQMGMTDHPVLRDPAGLDGTIGFEGGNLMSARDLAIAGRALLSVPELAHIVAERNAAFVDPTGLPHALPSMNWWFLQGYPGAIGLKTGYTQLAGNCIIAAATRHGRTMIAVVLKGYNMQQTAMDLLDQGFATPAAAEPTADRLPPVRLPSPPAAQTVTRHGARGDRAGLAPGAPAGGRPVVRAPAAGGASGTHIGRSARAVAVAGARNGNGGLGPVLGSWLGELLLLASGLGAVLALSELLKGNRLRRDLYLDELGARAEQAAAGTVAPEPTDQPPVTVIALHDREPSPATVHARSRAAQRW